MKNKFILLFVILSLVNPNAFAGKLKKKGDILTEDSMVFTVEEAQKMQIYISELESKTNNLSEVSAAKDELIENKSEQIQTFEEYLKIKDEQIKVYLELNELNKDRIITLEKEKKYNELKTIGTFAGGAILAIGTLIIADKIDDYIVENPVN